MADTRLCLHTVVLRLGLCSHALLYKQARSEDNDLSDLLRAGLLTAQEHKALGPLPSKAQGQQLLHLRSYTCALQPVAKLARCALVVVVWSWLTLFWSRALGGELDCTVPPAAAQLLPLVMEKCMRGRGSIGAAMTVSGTIAAAAPFTR